MAKGNHFVLGNHTSFLDTVITVSKLPTTALRATRCYMSNSLFQLPLLGAICKANGHFPVYFKSDTAGKFSVDKEKQAPPRTVCLCVRDAPVLTEPLSLPSPLPSVVGGV